MPCSPERFNLERLSHTETDRTLPKGLVFKMALSSTSLVVQWLRLCAPNARYGFNPSLGEQRSHMLHSVA